MTFVYTMLLIIAILTLAYSIWRLVAITIAGKQRLQLLDWIFYHNNYDELLGYYDKVTYDKHIQYFMMFRNPYKLYDPELFSTFHLIKHGTSVLTKEGKRLHNKEIICPYTPK